MCLDTAGIGSASCTLFPLVHSLILIRMHAYMHNLNIQFSRIDKYLRTQAHIHTHLFILYLIYTGYLSSSPAAAVESPLLACLLKGQESLEAHISITGMHIVLLLIAMYAVSTVHMGK